MKLMEIVNPVVGVSIYKSIFNARYFIGELENECEKSNGEVFWENSSVGYGSVGEYRTSLTCNLQEIMIPGSQKKLHKMFYEHIHKPIKSCIEDYSETYGLGGMQEPFQVLKYTLGCNYRAHHDDGANNPRTYSLVSILQAPETGGDLEFPLFDYTYKPETGDVVMFPANYPYTHIAHPVDAGIKYSMVTWFK
jgi:hypothetical protein